MVRRCSALQSPGCHGSMGTNDHFCRLSPRRTGGTLRAVRIAGRPGVAAIALVLAVVSPGCGPASTPGPAGVHKIRHVVIVLQENRSFDSYFGTFPGADGYPMAGGQPTVCIPDPVSRACVKPYADHSDVNHGGPHDLANARADIDDGRMDGFLGQAGAAPDVMGYHTAGDIPNYWRYAQNFVIAHDV